MSTPIGESSALGSGMFGRVYKMDYHGALHAVKVFGYGRTKKFTQPEKERFLAETRIIRTCKHDNIVQYIAKAEAKINESPYPALVMTLMDMSLCHYLLSPLIKSLAQYDLDANPHRAIKIVHDIACALHYLHSVEMIVHGDLHSGNVLLKCITAHEGPLVKLCDFGFSSVSIVNDVLGPLPIEGVARFSRFVNPTMSPKPTIEYSHSDSSFVVILPDSEDITSPGVTEVKIDEEKVENDIRKFGKIMWNIHTKQMDYSPGSTQKENLEQIQKCMFHYVVEMCWSDDGLPTALRLLEIFKDMKKAHPVKDTTNETISKLTTRVDKLLDENTALRKENKDLKETIAQSTTQN